MKKFVIYNVQVVGMHHYGRRELSIGAVYKVDAEPLNQYDQNAVAVYDGPSASSVSRIIRENKAKSNYYLKPLSESVVQSRHTGPQQTCAIAFKCTEEDANELLKLAEAFTCVFAKVMNV